MQEKEKEKPPPPNKLDVARLLESVEIEDWIKGSEIAARYVIATARQHDPHLREILEGMEALYRDVAEIATENWPLILVEVEQDLERCLEEEPESFLRFALDLVRSWSSGRLEWKPTVLLHLVRGRRARGEGDDARLAWLEEEAAALVERARECLADEEKLRAWQRELQERLKQRGAGA